jgi:molybdate transport system substrate-binding protein
MTRSLSHRWGPPLTILLALLALIAPGMTAAGEVRIAVAANFAAPMKSIAAQFERGTGHRLLLAPGATGQLYAQIRNGAPFDILLSADETTPAKLESEGLGVAGSRFTYAIGRLVLWSRTSGFVDARGDVLRSGQFTRIAIANPKLAPYGAAALATLERMGLGDRIAPRIVEGTNISQTFQFVATGNAPLGFVALSQVLENGALKSGSGWVVPDSMHPPIRQNAILLNRARGQAAATALLDYLKGEQARAIIRSFGYGV